MFQAIARCLFSMTLILGFLALPVRSSAMMVGLSTDELTDESDLVVTGEVESSESAWSTDGKTIFTYSVVIIGENLKGEPSEKVVTVVTEGGEVGRVGLKVSDSEPLVAGEKVLLFLKSESAKEKLQSMGTEARDSTYRLVGKAQGRYTVGPDGVARKKGYSLADREQAVDSDIPVAELAKRIKGRTGR